MHRHEYSYDDHHDADDDGGGGNIENPATYRDEYIDGDDQMMLRKTMPFAVFQLW